MCVFQWVFKMIIPSSLCVPVSKTTLIAPWQQKPKSSVKRQRERERKGKEEEEKQEEITRGRQIEGV